jgi:hypothetical protein
MIATARGILGELNQSLLVETGGHINLSRTWAESLIKRMGWSRRRATKDGRATPHNISELSSKYHEMVSTCVTENKIPLDMVVKFDQTDVNSVPRSQWTMNKKGAKQVAIAGVDDKRQITMVLANTPRGDVLPPQVVYQGNTTRCHPSFIFPPGWHITHSSNHWSNEETMLLYVKRILNPYYASERKRLGLAKDHPALVILDVFAAHRTKAFKQLCEDSHIKMMYVPASCTGQLQPLDVSGNGDFKTYLKDQFIEWYSKSMKKCVHVDMKLSTIKPVHAKWMVMEWEKFKSNPHLFLHGWRKTGLLAALGVEVIDCQVAVETLCADDFIEDIIVLGEGEGNGEGHG